MNSRRISCSIFAAVVLLCSVFAHGQGSLAAGNPIAVSGSGQPLSGATVAITSTNPCGFAPTYPSCNGLAAGFYSGTLPPSGLIVTYTDITLATVCSGSLAPLSGSNCSNPGLTDGLGNVVVYANPASYWCTYYGSHVKAYVIPCIFPSSGTGSGGFTSNVGFQAIPAANPDLVWAVDPAGTCAYDANILTQGQIQVCNSGNGSLWLDAGSGPSQIFVTRLTSPASLTNGATPQYVTANNDFEILPPNSTNTLPAAQVGDTIRFNSAGDNNWDAVNYAQEFNAVYAVPGGTPVGFGPICNGNIGFATGTGNSDVFATATRRAGKTYNITPSASTSTVEGMTCGQNGSNSLFPMLAWYRFSALMAFGSSTNSRYWVGLATWNNGSGTGTNSTVILNTTKLATDTPNSNLMGFRYSATTDTDFQAASCVAGGSCTVTDTGVAFDTNPHLFEMAMNSGGTSINYLIDGKVKATITSNIPAAAGNADGQVDMFWVADNKNTVTSPNATIYSMSFSLK